MLIYNIRVCSRVKGEPQQPHPCLVLTSDPASSRLALHYKLGTTVCRNLKAPGCGDPSAGSEGLEGFYRWVVEVSK